MRPQGLPKWDIGFFCLPNMKLANSLHCEVPKCNVVHFCGPPAWH